jgi:hypothetical protein
LKVLICIDPGKLSGLSVITVEDDQSDALLVGSWELLQVDLWDKVSALLETYPGCVVICERFVIGMATAKMSFQPWSLENIGAIKTLMHLKGLSPEGMVLQSASAAKGVVSNDMLRQAQVWHRGGQGHANDASRHGILYLLQHGWRPQSLLQEVLEESGRSGEASHSGVCIESSPRLTR